MLKARQVKAGEVWRLGKSHLLYCGSPTDARFQKLLPSKIELLLRFTISSNDLTEPPPAKTVSSAVLRSPYQEMRDPKLFRELFQNMVDYYTDPGEAVLLINLPDPSILILLDELESRCFCAEPSSTLCEEAINAWHAVGKQVERYKS